MSLADENKRPLAESEVLSALFTMSRLSDVETARQAAGAVANLCECTDAHAHVVAQVRAGGGGGGTHTRTLSTPYAPFPLTLCLRGSTHTRCRASGVGGVRAPAVTLAGAQEGIHFLVQLMRSRNMPVYREAARACSNLLSSRTTHLPFLKEKGLKSVFRIARVEDFGCTYAAALMYRKLAATQDSHEGIVTDGLPPLLALCRAPDTHTRFQAAATLRDLCSNPAFKWPLVEKGALSVCS